MMAAAEIGWGARMLSGTVLTLDRRRRRRRSPSPSAWSAARARTRSSVLALLGDGRDPVGGVRGRPSVPHPLHGAADRGRGDRRRRRRRHRAGAPRCAPRARSALLALAGYELRPLDAAAPMVVEAQWDRPNAPLRAQVTACLAQPLRGEKIMASMGSLGHYMQEASRAGFAIRDFLHEGNGDIWLAALERPAPVRGLDADRGEGGRRRHARAPGARAAGVSRRDTSASAKAPGSRSTEGTERLRAEGCEPGPQPSALSPQPCSEPDVDREQVGEAAEIDLGAGEVLVGGQIALRRLVPDLAADAPRPDRNAHAAENHRAGRGAAADEGAAEDRSVGREELPASRCSGR